MTYISTLVEGNRYKIETDFNGDAISFDVVVANNESEIQELVEDYLDLLANPCAVQQQQTPTLDLASLVQEQQAQISSQAAVITTLTERITALESQ